MLFKELTKLTPHRDEHVACESRNRAGSATGSAAGSAGCGTAQVAH